ncbi:hypothetical protein SB775_34275, partial [Peribacillus sp. SIMBA_075]
PHLSRQITRHVRIGDQVRVRGVKPRGADVIAAVSFVTKSGRIILDNGPHEDGGKHQKPDVVHSAMEACGQVALSLF